MTAVPCNEDGTIGNDRVPNPTQGFRIAFQYYLPPCYSSRTGERYPVLYLVTDTFESSLDDASTAPFSMTNRLVRSGKMPPAIVVVPSSIVGYGFDAALTLDLVPYMDSHFRTIQDAAHRGVGGISHGAAISVRMAFQFPETFGSAGLLSGGIDSSEEPRFGEWINRTPPGQWPRVLIDVGDQDAIFNLTSNLMEVLDQYQVPYTLNRGPGGHNGTYWGSVMESYLLWFAGAWE
jgi:enterochelin esterase-like enzyme